jgi:hypothetical protein
MSIIEESIKVGDIYKLKGPYECTIKISNIRRFKYSKGMISPYIEGLDEFFDKCDKPSYPIFYGMTDNGWLNDTWFTFRDYITEKLLGDNIVAIYPDDEDYSFRVWNEKEGIHRIETDK